ncbi:MAG: hypothetical protein QXU20_03670 [Candidatus Woesearchaeota archaeon]
MKDILEKIIKDKQEIYQNNTLLTDVITCFNKKQFKLQTTSTNKGKIIDHIIKSFFKDVNKTYLKEINYRNVKFFAKPDFIINNIIYELKTFSRLYISEKTLLQCYGYHKFYELPIKLIIITPDNIEEIDPFENHDINKISTLFDERIDKYREKIPLYEECENCFFRKQCPLTQDKISEFTKNNNYSSSYKIPFNIKDNSIIVTPSRKIYQVKYIGTLDV